MEFFRRVVGIGKKEKAIPGPFPYPAQKYYVLGQKFASSHSIDTQIQLQGKDKTLLHLLLGLKVLYSEIDSSQIEKGGSNNHIRERFVMRFDSQKTHALRETAVIVEASLDDFIASSYAAGLNRARTIQNAVNNLFTANYDENGIQKPLDPQTIAQWASVWKNRILLSSPSTQS